jgi:hypothetical protein
MILACTSPKERCRLEVNRSAEKVKGKGGLSGFPFTSTPCGTRCNVHPCTDKKGSTTATSPPIAASHVPHRQLLLNHLFHYRVHTCRLLFRIVREWRTLQISNHSYTVNPSLVPQWGQGVVNSSCRKDSSTVKQVWQSGQKHQPDGH